MRKSFLIACASALALAPSAVPAQYPLRVLDPRLVAEARADT